MRGYFGSDNVSIDGASVVRSGQSRVFLGLVPFIVVDAVKVMLAAGLVYTSWKAVLR